MPRLSCWFIRAALVYLGLGVCLGGLILSAKGLPIALGWAWLLLPAHIQLLVGGWLIQLALGVAYWILPRQGTERGRMAWAWGSWVTLNVGVSGTAGILAVYPYQRAPWLDVGLTITACLQLVALGAFGWHAAPRLRRLRVEGMQGRVAVQE